MKKLSLSFLYIAALASIATFSTSCGGDEDTVEPTVVSEDSCDVAVYPDNTGDAELVVLNYTSSIIEVEAETDLSLALQVTKGSNRAQKVRLFQSACKNLIGSEVDLSDQEKGGKNGIDLRATDAAQIRNVIYSVPTGFTTIYLTIEIDEAGGNYTYTQLTLEVTGSGIVDSWSNLTLGAQNNSAASRLSSGTGLTYTACNAAANIEDIDVTYAVATSSNQLQAARAVESSSSSYICSNPARFESLIGLTNSTPTAQCDEEEANNDNYQTNGGTNTYFATSTLTVAEFDAATDTELGNIVSSTSETVQVTAADQIIEFVNADGKKGLIKIESISSISDASGSIVVSVKVQR